MNAMHFIPAGPEAMFLSPAHMALPEPALIERPVAATTSMRPPRSAKRAYSAEELSIAAEMMDKLRRREDLTHLARENELSAAQHREKTLDAVVERLLRIL